MDEKNKIPGVSFIKRNIGTIIGLILLVIIVSINFYTEIPYIIKYSEPVKIQFSKCNHQLWYVTCNSDGRN